MEVYEMFTAVNGVSLGSSCDGIFYIRMTADGYWEEIPASTEKEAIKYYNSIVEKF